VKQSFTKWKDLEQKVDWFLGVVDSIKSSAYVNLDTNTIQAINCTCEELQEIVNSVRKYLGSIQHDGVSLLELFEK